MFIYKFNFKNLKQKLNQIKTKTILLLIAMTVGVNAILIITSCRKDKHNLFSNSSHLSSQRVSNNSGILKFGSWREYNDYIDFLYEVFQGDTSSTSTDTLNFNERLDKVDDSLGFTSLRNQLHQQALAEQDNETYTFENDPESNELIGNPITQSIMNGNHQFQIADTFFQYINNDFLAASKKLTDLDDIKNDIHMASHKTGVWVVALKIGHIFQTGTTSKPDITANQSPCDYLVMEYGAAATDASGAILHDAITFTWDFGDTYTGNTNQYLLNGTWVTNTIFHTYSSTGLYHVTVTGYDANNNTTYTDSRDISVYVHCPEPLGKQTLYYYPLSGHRMRMEHWADNGNISGRYVGASTTHYEWKNNTWKEKKADRVVAQAYGTVIKQSDCVSSVNVACADWPYNSKTANSSFHVGEGFYNEHNALKSDHKILVNGTYYDYEWTFASPCD